jgi:RNA polymerase sigma factor (sigma-70 family)
MGQLRTIMEEHGEQLIQLAYFYTKSYHAAEDIVQDVFITFHKSNYEERGQLVAYLRKLTVNRSKDYLKSWSYRKLQLFDAWSGLSKRQHDRIVELEERSEIGAAVLSLPIHYREIILLYYFEEMSTPEIAELLGESDSTVRTKLRRAREKLKPLLQQQWEVLHYE